MHFTQIHLLLIFYFICIILSQYIDVIFFEPAMTIMVFSLLILECAFPKKRALLSCDSYKLHKVSLIKYFLSNSSHSIVSLIDLMMCCVAFLLQPLHPQPI